MGEKGLEEEKDMRLLEEGCEEKSFRRLGKSRKRICMVKINLVRGGG